jgi:very-short-patch-repair endonuclease
MSLISKEQLEEEYVNKKRSFGDIAKQLGTYANAVRRLAHAYELPIRDKSEAQAAALSSNRHTHPTKGKKRSEAVKLAISEKMAASWQNISDEEYDRRVENSRKQWESMSEDEKKNIQKLAIEAVRRTAKEGSQLEKFLAQHLKDENILIEFHRKGFVANQNLEVDILLPGNNIAIEVDGPSHFLPIWGEESLQKTMRADNDKNGLLLLYNIDVIRIKQYKKNLSMRDMRDIADRVVAKIKSLLMKKDKKAQIYDLEVK